MGVHDFLSKCSPVATTFGNDIGILDDCLHAFRSRKPRVQFIVARLRLERLCPIPDFSVTPPNRCLHIDHVLMLVSALDSPSSNLPLHDKVEGDRSIEFASVLLPSQYRLGVYICGLPAGFRTPTFNQLIELGLVACLLPGFFEIPC